MIGLSVLNFLIFTFWEVLVVLAEALVGFGDDEVEDDLEDGASNVVPLVVVLGRIGVVDWTEAIVALTGLLQVGLPMLFERKLVPVL